MTDRERLIELSDIIIQPEQKTLGNIADFLLANGVTVADVVFTLNLPLWEIQIVMSNVQTQNI